MLNKDQTLLEEAYQTIQFNEGMLGDAMGWLKNRVVSLVKKHVPKLEGEEATEFKTAYDSIIKGDVNPLSELIKKYNVKGVLTDAVSKAVQSAPQTPVKTEGIVDSVKSGFRFVKILFQTMQNILFGAPDSKRRLITLLCAGVLICVGFYYFIEGGLESSRFTLDNPTEATNAIADMVNYVNAHLGNPALNVKGALGLFTYVLGGALTAAAAPNSSNNKYNSFNR